MPITVPMAIAALTGLAVLVLLVAAVVHRGRRKNGGSVTGFVTFAVVLLLVATGLGLFHWLLPDLLQWLR
jgi:hypothetical protein